MMRWREIRVNGLGGGLLLSLFLHGLIVAVLLFDLPRPMAEPEPPEEVVAVTIVPPPEPEPEPEESAPEPEPAAEAPPEPEPAQAAESPPPPSLPEGESVPIPVLRPVFEFGEEDRGPEIALDGGAAQAPAEEPAETPPEERQSATGPEAEAEPEAAEAAPEAETAADVPPEPETPVADPAETPVETLAEAAAEAPVEQPAPATPAGIAVTDAELAGDQPAEGPEAAEQTETAALPEKPADPAPAPRQPDPAKAKPPRSPDAKAAPPADNGLPGVRAVSSSVDTGHAVATTAMGALPRDARGSKLCTTELREQLRRAPESYRVELLPAYPLPGGNVLAVPNAAFRAGGSWYNLSFRCTVDADALRVTAFSFKVGAPIPRKDWKARGFPEF